MTEVAARYTTAPNTIILELEDTGGRYNIADQAGLVIRGWDELRLAFDAFLRSQVCNPNIDKVADTGFNLIQDVVSYLLALGIDLEAANHRHLAKAWERSNQLRGRKT